MSSNNQENPPATTDMGNTPPQQSVREVPRIRDFTIRRFLYDSAVMVFSLHIMMLSWWFVRDVVGLFLWQTLVLSLELGLDLAARTLNKWQSAVVKGAITIFGLIPAGTGYLSGSKCSDWWLALFGVESVSDYKSETKLCVTLGAITVTGLLASVAISSYGKDAGWFYTNENAVLPAGLVKRDQIGTYWAIHELGVGLGHNLTGNYEDVDAVIAYDLGPHHNVTIRALYNSTDTGEAALGYYIHTQGPQFHYTAVYDVGDVTAVLEAGASHIVGNAANSNSTFTKRDTGSM
ncbi:hypothetical protein KAFR_0F00127 [Kazachstania africana CBS 2517]|uniref:Uncharacterized protein n=1 Tax=Kazachstania africana (strain ATCC 22294 / BCRC 22015 / CBS 2517 / CECT 1963 / NBRC 1671 / NRRL Y-8276) TaxID=1071382 RepID=H2AW58_KAZAF|nr:hypothetical protein KAFR_0F00127 [Kazachstania africana CBS 2517]CCF58608.1 hypothetical protein KAFR_0F00127 [Kazachstania africana CBS 2517]